MPSFRSAYDEPVLPLSARFETVMRAGYDFDAARAKEQAGVHFETMRAAHGQ